MTLRRLREMVVGTASERALKAAEAERERLSLSALLRGYRAMLTRATFRAEHGDPAAAKERDELAETVRRIDADRVRLAYKAYADRVRR